MDHPNPSSLFYDDSSFLKRESDIMSSVLTMKHQLTPDSHKYLHRAFIYRLLMIETSRIFLRERLVPNRENPYLYEITDIQIHLNSYYLNIRGAMDNLAWAMQHQYHIIDTVKNSNVIGLFGKKFTFSLQHKLPILASRLKQHDTWANELSTWRDPAAHHVPLYVPTGIITSQEQLDEFRRLDDLAGGNDFDRKGRRRIEFLDEARKLGQFHAVFVVENAPNKPECYDLPGRIAIDHDHFLSVCESIVDYIVHNQIS